MRGRVIRESRDFYELREEWSRMEQGDPDATFFSRFDVIWNWWKGYEKDASKKLFIVCTYSEDRPVVIAPLVINCEKRLGMAYNWISFMGMGDFCTFIMDRHRPNLMKYIRGIFEILWENSGEWDRIRLGAIPVDSLLAHFLLKSRTFNRHFGYSPDFPECPRVDILKYSSFEEYWKANIQHSVQRHINKLQKEVGYEFGVLEGKSIYEKISNLHVKEQEYLKKDMGRTERRSIFSDEKKAGYVKKLYETSGSCVGVELRVEGVIAALAAVFLYKGVLHYWNTAYDPDFETHGVGKILNYEAIKYAFERGDVDYFDFGSGRYPWKFSWTGDYVVLYQLDYWNENSPKADLMRRLQIVKSGLAI